MHSRNLRVLVLIAFVLLTGSHAALRAASSQAPQGVTGILLLAHGGSSAWNDNVRALAAQVNRDQPVEVAFGMATRANIQRAADALVSRGVARIVAVPLFVSSHSSVVTSTEYLLGLRPDAPADLAAFARMVHRTDEPAGTAGHHAHAPDAADGTRPVTLAVPIRMTTALDSDPIVAAILSDRARSLSTEPSREAVILVAHGPVKDAENEKWLANMRELADGVRRTAPFGSVDYLTVRDDAHAPIKDAATAELRALVEKRRLDGSRVLIVPVLLSFGGIEQGIRKRLEGLEYGMASQAIMPDDRLVGWVKRQAAQ
jgi:sirohydrochlorin ferrochelatase